MLTRTAFVALERIARGLPAFPKMLEGGGVILERTIMCRRAALEDLRVARFIRREKFGPKITGAGLKYLARAMKGNVLPADVNATAERLGISPEAVRTRKQSIKRAVTEGV